MSVELKPDDIEVGQFVTVLRSQLYAEKESQDFLTGQMTTTKAWEDNSYKGNVLKVLAVDYPYVAFLDCSHGYSFDLDLRQWKLKKLSNEYIKALTKAEGKEQ